MFSENCSGYGGGDSNAHIIDDVMEDCNILTQLICLGDHFLLRELSFDENATAQDDSFVREPDKEIAKNTPATHERPQFPGTNGQ